MPFTDPAKLNKIASALYAFGVWTMVCSYAVYTYTGPYLVPSDESDKEDPNKVIYETAHTKCVITYKKDFVPYSTRISNFFSPSSAKLGTEGDDK